ncbi:MAG TPA: Rv3235 family protein [Mycobacteriales bacterium]|nr:Rv3235 family protein [Mycobacteriales bacterium]
MPLASACLASDPAPLPYELPAIACEPPLVDELHWPIPRPGADLLPLSIRRYPTAPEDAGWTPVVAIQPGTGVPEPGPRPELRPLVSSERTPRRELPDPRPRAAAAVRVLLEVLSGDRPARQVAAWVNLSVLARLEAPVRNLTRRMPRRMLLRSLRVSEPTESVVEVTAVVAAAGRARAVALRLEGLDGRWIVTDLCTG